MSVGVGPTSFHRASSITNLLYTHTFYHLYTQEEEEGEKNTHTHAGKLFVQLRCLWTLLRQIHADVDDDDEGPAIRGPFPAARHTTRTEGSRRLSGGPFVTFHLLLPYFSVTVDVFFFFPPSSFLARFLFYFFWKMAGYLVRCLTPNFSFLLYSLPSCPVYPFCISITLKNSRKRNLWFINKPRLPTPHQQRLKRREMKEGRKK